MFKASSIIFSIVFCLNIQAQKTLHYTPMTKPNSVEKFGIQFDSRHIGLGKVKRGDKREFEFKFTNTGTEDIHIEIVSACECSTLDWPTRAIKAGEIGIINVIFDSTEKEESETIEVDINLKNREADTGYKRLEIISFSFELIQ